MSAVEKAMELVKSNTYTYWNLVLMIESFGFSKNDSILAADNCGVNWVAWTESVIIGLQESEHMSDVKIKELLIRDGFNEHHVAHAFNNINNNKKDSVEKKESDEIKKEVSISIESLGLILSLIGVAACSTTLKPTIAGFIIGIIGYNTSKSKISVISIVVSVITVLFKWLVFALVLFIILMGIGY